MHKAWLASVSVATSALVGINGVGFVQPAVASHVIGVGDTSPQSLTIGFATGSLVLSQNAKNQLDAALPELQHAASVTVAGYTRGKRQSKALVALSLKRAQATAEYLRSIGLVASIAVKGAGRPVAGGNTSNANRVQLTYQPTDGLLWSQDFVEAGGTPPNPDSFSALEGDGRAQLGLANYGTGEIEQNSASAAYTDGAGNLVIHTSVTNGIWTSARIWTAKKVAFNYGRLEIRAKFPKGEFNWPAIWMLGANYSPPNGSFGTTPWPNSGELDITEVLRRNTQAKGTLHGFDPATGRAWLGGGGVSAEAPLTDIAGDYHVWGIDWEPNSVTFTLDGVWYSKNTFDGRKVTQVLATGQTYVFDTQGEWPFNQPFFLILNNAVPSRAFAPEGSSSEFLIDYIHYSKFNGFGEVVRLK